MTVTDRPPLTDAHERPQRITSIDALRGLVMFAMIFVNDIAGVDEIVPPWLRHYHGKSGMTLVDLVFPAFLFIVGMSIPFALGGRIAKGQPIWRIVLHVLVRTASLLILGVMMMEAAPSAEKMGWRPAVWSTLMFVCAIVAFSSWSGRTKTEGPRLWTAQRIAFLAVRLFAFAGLITLAFLFRDAEGRAMISLRPFYIRHGWYGILGLIGWAYLVGSILFLVFRTNRTAIVACMALLMSLYAAQRKGTFDAIPWVNIGEALGSHAAITVGGLLMASILLTPDTQAVWPRVRFTLLFIAGCALGALILHRVWGINKNNATPSWCLWASAITAALWLLFYLLGDVLPLRWATKPFAIAGHNVLLAYLLSEMVPPLLEWLHLGEWYESLAKPDLAHAAVRSAVCAVIVLTLAALLNRIGFRLKL